MGTWLVGSTVVAAGSPNRGGGSLVKVTLLGNGISASISGSGFSSLTGAVSSLAYCPVAGSDDAVNTYLELLNEPPMKSTALAALDHLKDPPTEQLLAGLNDPRADFNGVGGVTVQDIFDFLAAWFMGC